ncbi:MAG TPA: hypothetical protein VIT45_00715 [Allosphingosinicella sp.]
MMGCVAKKTFVMMESSLQTSRIAHAIATIYMEWSAIFHGIITIEAVLAVLVIVEALVAILKWAKLRRAARPDAACGVEPVASEKEMEPETMPGN